MTDVPESGSTPPTGQVVSLDQLSRAFAEAMGGARHPEGTRAADELESGGVPPDGMAIDRSSDRAESAAGERADISVADVEVRPVEAEDSACEVSPRSILEAMLFVGARDNRPLSPARAAELMRGVEPGEIPSLVDALNRRYDEDGSAMRILSVGNGYRMVLRRGFDRLRSRFHRRTREARLSQAAIDILAIVAYRQPLSADEVSTLRGTPSHHVLSHLVHRRLLRIERPPGVRKAVYRTTGRFLELFDLERLEDLPQAEDLEPR